MLSCVGNPLRYGWVMTIVEFGPWISWPRCRMVIMWLVTSWGVPAKETPGTTSSMNRLTTTEAVSLKVGLLCRSG